MSKPRLPDQRAAKFLGVALVIAGAYCLHDAYEGRGKTRPLPLRFLP